ncbi:MAG: protein kinase [Candidatus Eisenbacteria bacterium]|nr:protein kinase [Candidatus Eisenbacteria bacterium]
MRSWPRSWASPRPMRPAWRWAAPSRAWQGRWVMSDRDRLLDTLGLDVSDGRDPDWDSLAGSVDEGDQALLRDLRSLSLMAGYFRARREEVEREGAGPPAGGRPARLSPGDRWGHLEILETLGEGSSAIVYRARDTHLNREVALKLMTAGARRDDSSISSEGERLARVKHPHLVTVHGAEERDGQLGIWMEHIRGQTLHGRIATQGPLGAREAATLGIELCGALAAVHGAGLIHGDVKAQNVMREEGGRTVLMDLGAGRERGPVADAPGGRVTGTPLYMAPEVLAGETGSVRSDVYSLGVLLFHAVTGAYPVAAQTLAELGRRHARGERQSLRDLRPDLAPSFVAVIERAVAPRPADRFASAGALERALAESLPGRETRRPRPRAGAGRWGLWLGLGALVGAAVLLFAWPGFLLARDYEVDARLLREGPGGTELLLPGARVAPGDRLHLEFEASREMYLYVLAEDERGAAFLLHPIPGSAAVNPLAADIVHRLPPDRDGQAYSWGVSSAGGTEHLLLIASPEALTDFEQTLAALPPPREAAAPTALPLDPDALMQLRGIGLLLPEEQPADPHAAHSAFALARELAAGPERGRGIWVRQIDLVNPGP